MDLKRIWIMTLFPEYFRPLVECGVLGRLFRGERGKTPISLELVDLKDFVTKRSVGVDDSPYGGGPGMLMRADVLKRALQGICERSGVDWHNFRDRFKLFYTSPTGQVWNQRVARDTASTFLHSDQEFIFLCGRYEGVDQRFIDRFVDRSFSLGDFVLTGGELAVGCLIDSFVRLIPEALGNEDSSEQDSFSNGLLEGPQYTRPAVFEGLSVPAELTSGHHAKIREKKQKDAQETTKRARPDLWEQYLKDNSHGTF